MSSKKAVKKPETKTKQRCDDCGKPVDMTMQISAPGSKPGAKLCADCFEKRGKKIASEIIRNGRERLSTHVELLPVSLTTEELLARSDRLANIESEISAEDERHAQMKAELKAGMTRLVSERSRLAVIVSQKSEPRNVEVAVYQVPNSHSVEIVRLDFNQIVRTREMTKEELQMVLPLGESGGAKSDDAELAA